LSLGVAEDAPVIGIVANLRPIKDHATFLQAANIVHAQIPTARFLIIGDGSEKPVLQKQTEELKLTDAVIFLGARLDVPRILSACDIGVLTSRSEIFTNAIVEYMAAGLTVVTTDVGGAREAVDDGINGFIVAIGDFEEMGKRSIELLKADTIKQMGLESRKRSLERFALTSMVAKTEYLYNRCQEGSN
jgi:glycosyltransferase involved in cell wall biosynthesis